MERITPVSVRPMAGADGALQTGPPPYWAAAKTYLRAADPIIAGLIDQYESPPLRSKGRLFETLIHSIVGQQISARAADAIWSRLVESVGDVSPEGVNAVPDAALRAVGLSGRKAEYIRGIVKAAPALANRPWSALSDDEIRAALTDLRGIGPWTADMLLIFCFLRPDILPLGDIGVVRVMERLYGAGQPLTPEALRTIASPWAPYRTVATWYLWRSLDPEPVEY